MSIDTFRKAGEALREGLVTIQTSKAFVKYAYDLRKAGHFMWNAVPPEQKPIVKGFLDQNNFSPEDINRALYAVTCALLERFVRALVQAAVQEVGKIYESFDRVPEKLINRNYSISGRALVKVHEPPDHWKVDFTKLARDLGTCVPGSKSVALSSEVFALFVGQVSPDNIREAFGWIGINIDWAELARHPKMKKLVQDIKNPPTELQDKLRRMVRARNRIVHMGEGVSTITQAELEEAVEFVGAFGDALVVQVERKVERQDFK